MKIIVSCSHFSDDDYILKKITELQGWGLSCKYTESELHVGYLNSTETPPYPTLGHPVCV